MPTETGSSINYSALQTKTKVTSKAWRWPLLSGAVLVVLGVAMGSVNSDNARAGRSVLITFGLIFGLISLCVYGWGYYKAKQAQFLQFITDNNWLPYNDQDTNYVATSLVGVGYDQRIVDGFVGQYNGTTVHGVHYQYTTGSGKSQQTHNFVNLAFDVSEILPLIILDNKHSEVLGIFSDLPERIPGGKKLQLEGDFNDTYNVTVMPGSEQEVLQFLTPDFMSALIDQAGKADIEMEANKLFIIFHGDGFNLANLQTLFAAADVVLRHVGQTADTWQASSSAETVENMAASALAPRANIMLRGKHVSIVGVVVVIIYIAVQIIIAAAGKHH